MWFSCLWHLCVASNDFCCMFSSKPLFCFAQHALCNLLALLQSSCSIFIAVFLLLPFAFLVALHQHLNWRTSPRSFSLYRAISLDCEGLLFCHVLLVRR